MAKYTIVNNFSDAYDIGYTLGVGGFGRVLKCISKTNGKEYAVKIIEEGSMYEECVDREVFICQKLDHRNVVKLFEAFKVRQYRYLVFDIMAGGDLFDEIVRRKKYTEYDACHCIAQVLKGVEYLHDRSIVHRDLKPENILLTGRGEKDVVKIADFGAATLQDGVNDVAKYHGTLYYGAPEVHKEDEIGPPADLWACGILLFITLVGKLPFGKMDQSSEYRILNAMYSFPEDENSDDVSDLAKDLIGNLITVDQSQRYTAKEALAHTYIREYNRVASRIHRTMTIENMKVFNVQKREMKSDLFPKTRVDKVRSPPTSRSDGTVLVHIVEPTSACEAEVSQTSATNQAPLLKIEQSFEDSKFEDLYEKKQQIGRGGAGFVYECISKEDGEHYAVKVYKAPDAASRERINREIDICKMIDHKNIVTFIEAFDGSDIYHLVFEMMAGGDVFDDMARRTVYTEYDASHRMKQVFEGVAYLHENKILHRDLKPENLLLSSKDDDAVVKIGDFDSAVRYKGKIHLLNFGVSLVYCSPDIIRGDGYSFPADMWSCGVVLFLALFGELPFEGVDDYETVEKIMKGKYIFPKDCKPLCKEADDLIHGLLRIDQDTRCTARDALNNNFIKYRDIFATKEHRAKAIENIKVFNLKKRACRTETLQQFRRYPLNTRAKTSSIEAIETYRIKSDESTLSRMTKRAVTSVDVPGHIREASAQELQQAE